VNIEPIKAKIYSSSSSAGNLSAGSSGLYSLWPKTHLFRRMITTAEKKEQQAVGGHDQVKNIPIWL